MSVFLLECSWLPLHRRDAATDSPLCVQNECESIRMAVTATVESLSCETVAAVPSQPFKTLCV
jgi:hypothetical protein